MNQPKTLILVAGMHRSGTSAVTRIIAELGADLPGDVMPPAEDQNRHGFWESLRFKSLNDEILQWLGRTWDSPGPNERGWHRAPAARRFEDRIQDLLTDYFARSRLAVLKDPRLGTLLPLWKRAIANLGWTAKVLIPFRHPLEVAGSLNTRDHFNIAKGHLLWLRHNLAAERDTRDLARSFQSYSNLLADPRATIERVVANLDLDVDVSSLHFDSLLDSGERHHVVSGVDAPCPVFIERLYEILGDLVDQPQGTGTDVISRLDQIDDEVQEVDAIWGDVISLYDFDLGRTRQRINHLEHEKARLTNQVEAIGTERDQQYERANAQLVPMREAQLVARAEVLAQQLEGRTHDLNAVTNRGEAIKRELDRMRAEGSVARQQVSAMKSELELLRAKNEHLSQERDQLKERADDTFRLANEVRALELAIADSRSNIRRVLATIGRVLATLALLPVAIISSEARRYRYHWSARKRVRESALFNVDHYLCGTPEARNSSLPPAEHYLVINPSSSAPVHPLFDSKYYLNRHPDVERAGIKPLLHYIDAGAQNRNRPHPLLHAEWYARFYDLPADVDPLTHYLEKSLAGGTDPNPLFKSAWYSRRRPSDSGRYLNPLVDYVQRGAARGEWPHPLFDGGYYLDQNPDLAKSGINPLVHYLEFGVMEGRNPNRLFDGEWYNRHYALGSMGQRQGLVDYVESWEAGNRWPNPLFDPNWYGAVVDIDHWEIDPLSHYLSVVSDPNASTHPLFSARYYQSENAQAKRSAMLPLEHFISVGAMGGASPHPTFDVSWYADQLDQADAPDDPVKHFLDASKAAPSPCPLFDSSWYLDQVGIVDTGGEHPLLHYLRNAKWAKVDPHPLFNTRYYRAWANDPSGVDELTPLGHFLAHGRSTLISPNPLFDCEWYVATYGVSDNINPLVHYLTWGCAAGAKPNSLFHPEWYAERYLGGRRRSQEAFLHFMLEGGRQDYDPHPSFDSAWYRREYGINSSEISLTHYLERGARRSYSGSPQFDPVYYRRNNPDVEAERFNPYEHFVRFGAAEGRSAHAEDWTFARWARLYATGSPERLETRIQALEQHPLFTVLVSTGKEDVTVFEPLLHSLRSQSYSDWNLQMIVARSHSKTAQEERGSHNETWHFCSEPVDELVNQIKIARGTHLLILDRPGTLSSDALLCLAETLQDGEDWNAIYADEDVWLGDQPQRSAFKTAPDAYAELTHESMGTFVAFDRDAVMRAGTIKEEVFPWVRYDLFLRISEFSEGRIKHIPKVLFHHQMPFDGSFASDLPTAMEVVTAAVRRRGLNAGVVPDNVVPGKTAVKPALPEPLPRVSALVPTRNGLDVLRTCIQGLAEDTDYPNIELIVIDNGTDDPAALNYLNSLREKYPHLDPQVMRHDAPFNYSELNNIAAKAASGDILLLLNNDIEMIDDQWLRELVSFAVQPGIGAVGALLLYPDRTVQHAGVLAGVGGVAAHAFPGADPDFTEFQRWRHVRAMAAVTGACLAIRRDLYFELGGLDEMNLAVDFNDVDLCLRAQESGYANIWNPACVLVHHESKTRGAGKRSPAEALRFQREVRWMQARWFGQLDTDPLYNANYSLDHPFKLAFPSRPTPQTPRPDFDGLRMYASTDNPRRVREVVKSMDTARRAEACELSRDRSPGLSIIILTLDKPEFLLPLVDSLSKAYAVFLERGVNLEIIIGDTGSTHPDVLSMYGDLSDHVRVVKGLTYQFSRCNNQLFREEAAYDTVLFLNNDIEFLDNAAASLLSMRDCLLEDSTIGVVGAQLLYPTESIQHTGIEAFRHGPLKNFVYHAHSGEKPLPDSHFPKNVLAVTGACLMMQSNLFEAVQGFDEGYRTECQDAALCLSAARLGRRSVVISPGRIIHYENGTRPKGSEDWPDRQRFMRHWSAWIASTEEGA